MAISKDGYVARARHDNMRWLGATDKAVFRVLTGVDARLGVSARTAQCMPPTLEGRSLIQLSTKGMTLEAFHTQWGRDTWLIGGQTLCMLALDAGYVQEVHLCRSDRMAFPSRPDAISDEITPYMKKRSKHWKMMLETQINDVTVECWHRVRREAK